MRNAHKWLTLAAAGTALTFAAPANAAITFLGLFDGTDCSGQGGFSNCYAYPGGTQQGPIDLGSPVIVKYEGTSGDLDEISTNFPSIDGSEFVVDYFGDTNVLEFHYTPGADDPAVHFFTIKQSDGFALFHDSDPITWGSFDLDDYFPDNPGYSHISFFDSSTPPVPEPATWALMLLGFGAIGWGMRRRNSAGPRMRVEYN
jgi:hypothetical protein